MHGNVFVIDTEEKLSKRGHLSQPKKLLSANSIMVTCIGTGGVVAINAEPGHTNQQINSIILDDLRYLEWLFFTCRSMRTTIEMFGATGSTMTNLSKGKFAKVNLRHNNADPTGENYYAFVAGMQIDDIEAWYNETYQMCLLAF